MASIFPVIAFLVIVLGLMAVAWLGTPKGANQTFVASTQEQPAVVLNFLSHRLIRTSFMLTLACCYLIWMTTYLAQLHR